MLAGHDILTGTKPAFGKRPKFGQFIIPPPMPLLIGEPEGNSTALGGSTLRMKGVTMGRYPDHWSVIPSINGMLKHESIPLRLADVLLIPPTWDGDGWRSGWAAG